MRRNINREFTKRAWKTPSPNLRIGADGKGKDGKGEGKGEGQAMTADGRIPHYLNQYKQTTKPTTNSTKQLPTNTQPQKTRFSTLIIPSQHAQHSHPPPNSNPNPNPYSAPHNNDDPIDFTHTNQENDLVLESYISYYTNRSGIRGNGSGNGGGGGNMNGNSHGGNSANSSRDGLSRVNSGGKVYKSRLLYRNSSNSSNGSGSNYGLKCTNLNTSNSRNKLTTSKSPKPLLSPSQPTPSTYPAPTLAKPSQPQQHHLKYLTLQQQNIKTTNLNIELSQKYEEMVLYCRDLEREVETYRGRLGDAERRIKELSGGGGGSGSDRASGSGGGTDTGLEKDSVGRNRGGSCNSSGSKRDNYIQQLNYYNQEIYNLKEEIKQYQNIIKNYKEQQKSKQLIRQREKTKQKQEQRGKQKQYSQNINNVNNCNKKIPINQKQIQKEKQKQKVKPKSQSQKSIIVVNNGVNSNTYIINNNFINNVHHQAALTQDSHNKGTPTTNSNNNSQLINPQSNKNPSQKSQLQLHPSPYPSPYPAPTPAPTPTPCPTCPRTQKLVLSLNNAIQNKMLEVSRKDTIIQNLIADMQKLEQQLKLFQKPKNVYRKLSAVIEGVNGDVVVRGLRRLNGKYGGR